MQLTNRDRIGRALDLLVQGLAGPVDNVMRKAFDGQENWNELWAKESASAGARVPRFAKDDAHYLLKAIADRKFAKYFGALLNQHQRAWASELADVRNLWAHTQPISNDEAARALYLFEQLLRAVNVPQLAAQVQQLRTEGQRIQVGVGREVGANYQPRSFDAEVERLWSDGGDRRVWLRGAPGVGKSYSARRVMQRALADQRDAREQLLIWVDSADVASVTETFAVAADRLSLAGYAVAVTPDLRAERKARALLEVLATSSWSWLIILDNADAPALIEAGLVPSGVNPRGRVLFTTLSRDHRIQSHGRVVQAGVFSPEESTAFLRSGLLSRSGVTAGGGSAAILAELAEELGHHPLGLSIAMATITAHDMDITDWLEEFVQSAAMDTAADAADQGGYPHLLGATWRVALRQASEGLAVGVVERAALVAALQDPDGHPTWIWESEAIDRWVAGDGMLERRHGKPVVVQRLIDHGIVELRGPSWKRGHVATHLLGARAVREVAGAELSNELAGLLADAWLLRLSDAEAGPKPAEIRRNLAPAIALSGLSESAGTTIKALLSYAAPTSAHTVSFLAETLDEIAPYLELGGATGRAALAEEHVKIGLDFSEIGQLDDANARFGTARDALLELVNNPFVDDSLRARCLKQLGEVHSAMGEAGLANECFADATRIFERLADESRRSKDLGSNLEALAELYERLESWDKSTDLLGRSEELLRRTLDDELDGDPEMDLSHAILARRLAHQLVTLGRPAEAKELYRRAADLFGSDGGGLYRRGALSDLALLHIKEYRWEEAAACLTEAVDPDFIWVTDVVLLASVQARLGRADDCAATLVRAASMYSVPESDHDPFDLNRFPHEVGTVVASQLKDVRDIGIRSRWDALGGTALWAMEHGRWADAIGLLTAQLARAEQDADAGSTDYEKDLASTHRSLGAAHLQIDAYDKAVEHLERSVSILDMLILLTADSRKFRADLNFTLALLGMAHSKAGDSASAVTALLRAVNGYESELSSIDPNERELNHAALALMTLSGVYQSQGLDEEAVDCRRRRVQLWRDASATRSTTRRHKSQLADASFDLGYLLWELDRFEEAVTPLTVAGEIRASLCEDAPSDGDAREDLTKTLILLGKTLASLDLHNEAMVELVRAKASAHAAVEQDPCDLESQWQLAFAMFCLGELYFELERDAFSVEQFEQSSNIFAMLVDLAPGVHEAVLGGVLRSYAKALRRSGREPEAEATDARAEEIERRLGDN